eukprot:5541094-Prymnesium_polylepis.1
METNLPIINNRCTSRARGIAFYVGRCIVARWPRCTCSLHVGDALGGRVGALLRGSGHGLNP